MHARVCAHMCTCVCLCAHVYMCVHVCTCVHMCLHVCAWAPAPSCAAWRKLEVERTLESSCGDGPWSTHSLSCAAPARSVGGHSSVSAPRDPGASLEDNRQGGAEPGKGSREGIGEAAAGRAHQVRPQARAGCGGGGAAGRGHGRGWALPAPALSPRWEPHQDLAHTWPACSRARSSAAGLRDGVDPGARVAFLSHALLPHLVPLFSRYHLRPIEWVRQFLRGSGLAGKTPGLVGGRRGRG